MYSVEQILRNPWLLIQDIMGAASSWPDYLRKMFWSKDFNDVSRLKIVTFCYQNGVSEDVLHDVLSFTLKEAYNKERRPNVSYRYKYFDDPVYGFARRSAAYALDLTARKVLDLNGNPRVRNN